MSLKETYFGNLGNVKKMDPGAVIIDVTRRAGSVLSPSWDMLNEYKAGKITWDGYIERFVREMDNPVCRAEMLRIGELAETKDVYLVCFERVGNCHRFLLVDMIKGLMLDDGCRRVNQLVSERPDLVKACYDNIAKALRVEA
ncbi:MAG: hypothetical protein OIN88_16040 [Candidatus Methanoperedens sp.]|nr:hypothetical protein [Candidatus Methanoperedens sp.]